MKLFHKQSIHIMFIYGYVFINHYSFTFMVVVFSATPNECLVHFLTNLKAEAANVSIPETMRTLIFQSLELASGINTYPKEMSAEISARAKVHNLI